jgi:hypothetical protein
MRKAIIYFVVIAFTGAATFLVTGILIKIHKKKTISEKISKLPVFAFQTLNKETFSSSDIKTGPLLIIRFHPECEHCQYEISEILKSSIPESGPSVILVSSAPPDLIKEFLRKYNYCNSQYITVLIDTAYVFEEIFGSDIVPSNYIYNKKLALVKVLHGEVKTETVLKYLYGFE